MAQAPDSIKIPPGSVMEIHRIPGYILQTKGMSKVGKVIYLCSIFTIYINEMGKKKFVLNGCSGW
jgi:hypothetical protein